MYRLWREPPHMGVWRGKDERGRKGTVQFPPYADAPAAGGGRRPCDGRLGRPRYLSPPLPIIHYPFPRVRAAPANCVARTGSSGSTSTASESRCTCSTAAVCAVPSPRQLVLSHVPIGLFHANENCRFTLFFSALAGD